MLNTHSFVNFSLKKIYYLCLTKSGIAVPCKMAKHRLFSTAAIIGFHFPFFTSIFLCSSSFSPQVNDWMLASAYTPTHPPTLILKKILFFLFLLFSLLRVSVAMKSATCNCTKLERGGDWALIIRARSTWLATGRGLRLFSEAVSLLVRIHGWEKKTKKAEKIKILIA